MLTPDGQKAHLLKLVNKKSGSKSLISKTVIPAPCAASIILITLYFLHNDINSLIGILKDGNADILSKTAIVIFYVLSYSISYKQIKLPSSKDKIFYFSKCSLFNSILICLTL